MAWGYLLIAAVLEIAWAVGLKYTNGFTRPLASVLTVVGMILSFVFLALAVRDLPVGTAYAVWTGIGAVGAVVFGIILFGEAVTVTRMLFLALIIAGVAGLRFTTA